MPLSPMDVLHHEHWLLRARVHRIETCLPQDGLPELTEQCASPPSRRPRCLLDLLLPVVRLGHQFEVRREWEFPIFTTE